MTALNKQALRLTAEKAKDNFMPNFMFPLATFWRCWMSWKPQRSASLSWKRGNW